jgi:hypothetical protein
MDVVVGHFDAVFHRAEGVADLQSDVPQGVEESVGHGAQVRMRFAAVTEFAVVEEQNIDIALRTELGAAVTADRHQSQGRIGVLRVEGDIAFDPGEQIAEEDIQHRGPGLAGLASAGSGPMQDFQPMRFDLEKRFVSGEFIGRLAVGRQHEAFGGAGLDFLQQRRHDRNLGSRHRSCKPGAIVLPTRSE